MKGSLSVENIKALEKRIECFSGKEIMELSDEEIKEFIDLRNECRELFAEFKERIETIWESISK